jgi:hypothetical protein
VPKHYKIQDRAQDSQAYHRNPQPIDVEAVNGCRRARREHQGADSNPHTQPIHRSEKSTDTLQQGKYQAGPGNRIAGAPRALGETLGQWQSERNPGSRHLFAQSTEEGTRSAITASTLFGDQGNFSRALRGCGGGIRILPTSNLI